MTIEQLKKYSEEIGAKRKLYYENYLSNYRKRVNDFYKEYCEEYSNFFKFIKPIIVYTIVTNEQFYEFIYENKDADSFKALYYYIPENDFKKFTIMPKHIKENYLLDKLNLPPNHIKFKTFDNYYEVINGNYILFHNIDSSENDGFSDADLDYNGLQLTLSFNDMCKVKTYIEFENFNTEELINKVNDIEFSYEFNETIEAYKYKLFLAASCTAEVCIETLLKLAIIRKLSKNELPNRRYIFSMGKKLLDRNIIDEKFFNRLLSVNELRHGISHSSTGESKQWDAEQIISVIKFCVDELF